MDEKKVELTFKWWKKFKPITEKTPKIDSELTSFEVAMEQLDFETARSAMRHIEKEWKPHYDALKKSKDRPTKELAKRIQTALDDQHQWLRDRMDEAAKREDEKADDADIEVVDDGKEFVWRRDVSKDINDRNLGLTTLVAPENWIIAMEVPEIAINKKGKPRVLLTALLTERLDEVYHAYLEKLCSQIVKIDGMAAGDLVYQQDEKARAKLLATARAQADKLSDMLSTNLDKAYSQVLGEYLTDKSIYERYKRKKKLKIGLASAGILVAGLVATVTAVGGGPLAPIAIPLIAGARALAGVVADIKDNHAEVAKVEEKVIKSINKLAVSLTNLKDEVASAKAKAKEEGLDEDEIWEEQSKVFKGIEGAKDEMITRKGQRLKSAAAIAIRMVTGQRHGIFTTTIKLTEEVELWDKKLSEARISAEHMAREVLKLIQKIDKGTASLNDLKSDKTKRKALEVVKKTRSEVNDLLDQIAEMNKAIKVSKAKRDDILKIAAKLKEIGPSGIAKVDAIGGVLADLTLMITGAGYSSFDPSKAINSVSYIGLAADEVAVLDDLNDAV